MTAKKAGLQLAFCLFKYFPHGGLQRDVLRIAQACQSRGHQVHIYTGSWEGAHPEGIQVTQFHVTAWSNHRAACRLSRRIQQALATEDFNIIVGFNKMPGLDIYFAADGCFAGRHGPWSAHYWLPRYRLYRRLEHAVFALEARTVILTLTSRQQAEYEACYQTPSERFIMMPPNLSPDRRRPANANEIRAEIRNHLGLSPEQQLLLHVGSAFQTKGLDRSLRALASLPDSLLSQTVLAVVGSNKHKAAWERRARKQGIHSQIRFLGLRDDIMALMMGADLLLHPSRRDSAGMVLLEALVAGLPTIATAACGYAFHINQADSGWVLSKPFTQEDYNRSLHAALNQKELDQKKKQALAYAARVHLYGMADAAVQAIEHIAKSSQENLDGSIPVR